MHSSDPQGTKASPTNPLWLNYCLCTFKIGLYKRCFLESQLLLMQREYGNKANMDAHLVKNWIVTRASKYQISV